MTIEDKKVNSSDKKRANIYLNSTILDKVDEYSNEFGVNRSAMIAFILKQYIDQQEVIKLVELAKSK